MLKKYIFYRPEEFGEIIMTKQTNKHLFTTLEAKKFKAEVDRLDEMLLRKCNHLYLLNNNYDDYMELYYRMIPNLDLQIQAAYIKSVELAIETKLIRFQRSKLYRRRAYKIIQIYLKPFNSLNRKLKIKEDVPYREIPVLDDEHYAIVLEQKKSFDKFTEVYEKYVKHFRRECAEFKKIQADTELPALFEKYESLTGYKYEERDQDDEDYDEEFYLEDDYSNDQQENYDTEELDKPDSEFVRLNKKLDLKYEKICELYKSNKIQNTFKLYAKALLTEINIAFANKNLEHLNILLSILEEEPNFQFRHQQRINNLELNLLLDEYAIRNKFLNSYFTDFNEMLFESVPNRTALNMNILTDETRWPDAIKKHREGLEIKLAKLNKDNKSLDRNINRKYDRIYF